MKNIAIILAGGSGKRLDAKTPKQFLKVEGKMIIEHTIDVFQKHKQIDEIVVVCNIDYISFLQEAIQDKSYTKIKAILHGGKERYNSSLVAIEYYNIEPECKMLFHDAVRPLVKPETISECIQKLEDHNAVGVGIMTTDTIWNVENTTIKNIPNRENMYRAQTPQGFKLSTIKKSYEIAMLDEQIKSTDDCGMVINYLPKEVIGIVQGSEQNIKITRQEDLEILERHFSKI